VEARYKSGKPVSVTDFRRETELGYGQIRVVGPFLVAVFNQSWYGLSGSSVRNFPLYYAPSLCCCTGTYVRPVSDLLKPVQEPLSAAGERQ
jgi:hypothetical protein